MKAIQSNRLAMYNAVIEFLRAFVDSPTAASLLPALAAKLATLITLVDNLVAAAASQEQPIDGKLARREQALADATEATAIVAGMVWSYARANRRPELAAEVRRVRTEFRRMRRAERMRVAQRVHDLALPLVAELADFGLTAAMLEELQTTIDATMQAVNEPVSTKAVKKVSTRELTRLFTEIEVVLAAIDPMLLKLRRTDPTSHALYLAARTVFDRRGARAVPAEPDAVPEQPPAEAKAA